MERPCRPPPEIPAISILLQLSEELSDTSAESLVTDVRMPVMDGWELSSRLRERWPDLPVLYISGYDIELSQGAKRRASGAFLRKPFDLDELLRQVGRLLAS
jgi:FixJ family two-component response regulator